MSFIFISAALLVCFLRIEDKQALLSLFLKALGGGMDCKVVDGKIAHSKYTGSEKASSEKVSGSLVGFTLLLLLLSTKSCKKCFGIYFLKSY